MNVEPIKHADTTMAVAMRIEAANPKMQVREFVMNAMEAARLSGTTNQTVRRWCKSGKLRHWKIDGRRELLIDAGDVREMFRRAEQ